jgi:hypothetical protein
MTKNYENKGLTLEQYLKKAGDVRIGLVETGELFELDDFNEDDVFMFRYECGFACGQYDLEKVIEEMEYYNRHFDDFVTESGENAYVQKYGRLEPTDVAYELYYVATEYVVEYEENGEEYDIVWMKKKGGKR